MFDRALPITVSSSSSEAPQEVELVVSQDSEGSEAVVVWDAALVLGYFLQRQQGGPLGLRGRRVLELGAGTGAVGIIAAALGGQVTVTDVPAYVPLLERNASANRVPISACRSGGSVAARELQWGDGTQLQKLVSEAGGDFDVVLVSDCVYYHEAVGPLVDTLKDVLGRKKGAVCLLSYEERYSEEKQRVQKQFFDLLKEAGIEAKAFPTDQCHEEYASDDIKVLQLMTSGKEQ